MYVYLFIYLFFFIIVNFEFVTTHILAFDIPILKKYGKGNLYYSLCYVQRKETGRNIIIYNTILIHNNM